MPILTERETIDRIEVLPETGHVQVRVRQSVVRVVTSEAVEGEEPIVAEEEVSFKFLRYVLEKDSDLSGQPDLVRAVAEAAWGITTESDSTIGS